MTDHVLGQLFNNKAWSVRTDENTVTLQDYLPKISQQSYDSTLFNVHVAEKVTKHSGNTLLCLVTFSATQTLLP